MSKKKIAIIGATGFTGSELVRLLYNHPFVEIRFISSESRAGESISDVHPFFRNLADTQLEKAEQIADHVIDLAFLALPHGVSMDYVEKFKGYGFPMVDLSGDFRLDNAETYQKWYKKDHSYVSGFGEAVYGLPELFRDEIKFSKLIANPGCYPTSVILGLAPLVANKLLDPGIIIADSKSGVTGAGIKSKPVNHFSSVNDNFKAYGLKNHRHSIEIKQKLESLTDTELNVQFTPHLLPVDRGILSTIYVKPAPSKNISDRLIKESYEDYFRDEPFIRLRKDLPCLKDVRATNYCDIFTTYDERTNNIIIISAIDNLVKGAAGQAIQNMNILFGWDEKSGLELTPLSP